MDCPEPKEIADLVDGRLSPVELAQIEQHLDDCSRCAELVAVAVSSRHSATAPTPGGDPAIAPGSRLGRYEVLRWIGRGGMGDVYEGFDPDLERRVAIKVLREFGDDSAAAQRRLAREAKTLARLSSPNVVAALDVGVSDDRLFLVMELVEGQTLAEWLRAAPRPWRQILDVFLAAGDGLAAAHEVGVIHRDFKPQNVLIGNDGRIRVSDFGLARHPSAGVAPLGSTSPQSDREQTGPGRGTGYSHGTEIAGGTPRYMSPEQFLRLPLDQRADQFSFCVALYEALYGCHPFAAGRVLDKHPSAEALRRAVLEGSPAGAPKNVGATRVFASVLARGLAREPTDRFPALRDLLAAIRSAALPSRRRRLAWRVAIAAGVTIVGATGIWVSRRPTPPLELTGVPGDWTSARIVFRAKGRIHCMDPISPNTLRVVWGLPRQVADIDVRTGESRQTELVPESYRQSCPQLSPDGRQLIFEGYDHKDRPYIFHAANPTGRDAEPVVPSAEPTFESQPLWLASNKDFIFDLGTQHPAVFSLETNRSTILRDADRSTVSNIGFQKIVNRTRDRIAIVQDRGNFGSLFIKLYAWPGLKPERDFLLPLSVGQVWTFGTSTHHLFGWGSGAEAQNSFGVVLDVERRTLTRATVVSGRDVNRLVQVDATTAVISTARFHTAAVYRDALGRERQVPQPALVRYISAEPTPEGEILLSQLRGVTTSIVRYRPLDETLHPVTEGPSDRNAAPLRDGGWLMVRDDRAVDVSQTGIWRCWPSHAGQTPKCSRVSSDVPVSGIAISPDRRVVAYQAMGAELLLTLRLTSLDDGKAVDIVDGPDLCQLFWSGPHTLWFSRRKGKEFRWNEIDVRSKKLTGKTAPGTAGCFDGIPDPILRSRSQSAPWLGLIQTFG